MKPGTHSFTPSRLLGQLWERIWYLHYVLTTEWAKTYWGRGFICYHGCGGKTRLAMRGIKARKSTSGPRICVPCSCFSAALESRHGGQKL